MLAIYIRSLVLVCFAVLAMRLMGKRQVGQLQPFELVVAIMIADLASTPMESLDIPLWRGIIPLAATITLHQLFTLLSLKSQRMRAFSAARPRWSSIGGRSTPRRWNVCALTSTIFWRSCAPAVSSHLRTLAPPSWKPAENSAYFPDRVNGLSLPLIWD